jgi:Domain of unknown function (DUF4062)
LESRKVNRPTLEPRCSFEEGLGEADFYKEQLYNIAIKARSGHMAQKKKLQVFISSTYSDLHEERQAAVEAILTAGHIPAGMELFAAGDESQMTAIKRWIDESDVYMLILGGRYGSIEPKSKKSYIQLEYEYALEKNKPLFAVVINEDYLEKKVKKYGSSVIEKDHPDKLKEFRELVCSKMVRFWSDPKDIKLSIMETIAEFSNRPDLIGWIPGNETINSGAVAEEIARLIKENTMLKEQMDDLSKTVNKFNGLSFDEMYSLLNSYTLHLETWEDESIQPVKEVMRIVTSKSLSENTTLLHAYWALSRVLSIGVSQNTGNLKPILPSIKKLIELGLIETEY